MQVEEMDIAEIVFSAIKRVFGERISYQRSLVHRTEN
jgi:hypothetical protein